MTFEIKKIPYTSHNIAKSKRVSWLLKCKSKKTPMVFTGANICFVDILEKGMKFYVVVPKNCENSALYNTFPHIVYI